MSSRFRMVSSTAYALARRVFWALPAPLRSQLHGLRHSLVHWFRRHGAQAKPKEGDLLWAEFRDLVVNGAPYPHIVIFEANVDWGIALFQRPHHMAIALGRRGCLVIFKTLGDGVTGFRQVSENVWLASDGVVGDLIDAVYCVYSTSLLANVEKLHSAKNRGRVVYEYIDHIDASISGGTRALNRLQELKCESFNGSADLVVSSALTLYQESLTQCGTGRCIYVPNGVDVEHYRDARHEIFVLPDALSNFQKKHRRIVGYFGAIAPWLWYEMLDQLSVLMPDVGFVFIGPDYSGCVPKLPNRNNVLYLDSVHYAILPAYARQFDICFIPFRPGDVARSTSPLKLYEYFALEKPVVVTSDMNECVAFPEVFSGGDARTLVHAIEHAFHFCNDEAYCVKLRKLANENSWDVRAQTYMAALSALPTANESSEEKL